MNMMYGYLTLSDGTGVAHSEMKPDGQIKVYFEKPVEGGFLNATCWLPKYRWENIDGFSDDEIKKLEVFLKNNAHLIVEYAQDGGFDMDNCPGHWSHESQAWKV